MAREFENVIDYVRAQHDTFEERGVCRPDSLVFATLSYLRLPEDATDAYGLAGLCLGDLYRPDWIEPMCGPLFATDSFIELLEAVATSPRFSGVRVSGYVSHTDASAEEQFSAMTFHLSPRATYVAFRGTDNTLVGWREDFNMAFVATIPAQRSATLYVEGVAARTKGRLWLGGHSKGGNLAVFAGMNCADATFERVVSCFSHDGPGFSDACRARGHWEQRSKVVDKTIPQSSVIGMVFERQEWGFRVVRSHAVGFAQHDPFSWEIVGCDFAYERRLDFGASYFDSSLNDWLQTSDPSERERLIDVVFMVLRATGETTFAGIKRNWKWAVPRVLLVAATLDPEDRQFVQQAVTDIWHAVVPDLPLGELGALVGNGAAGIKALLTRGEDKG